MSKLGADFAIAATKILQEKKEYREEVDKLTEEIATYNTDQLLRTIVVQLYDISHKLNRL